MAKETKRINATKNYRLFARSDENRPLDIARHKKLEKSMKTYGFLSCFPIVCYRNEQKQLVVKDGQHRLAIAETLGLPVYWVEDSTDFDVAKINSSAQVWKLADYAQKYAANGVESYREGLDFSEQHQLPIGTSFSLLAGTTEFKNISNSFYDGSFKVKDRAWADAVAGIYKPLTVLSPLVRSARFVEACMCLCRVDGFDASRLIHSAERCREKLVSYSTREAYLDMLDEVYNFGRSKRVALKFQATEAMRQRSATAKAVAKKQESANGHAVPKRTRKSQKASS